MTLYPLRLQRKLDYRLWGGQRLARWLDLPEPLPTDLAESWQVYESNQVLNGPLSGRTLAEVTRAYGADLVGTLSIPRYGLDFPLLAKFLDANAKLSIQVHPDDAYAHSVEAHTGFHGKTEAWYILHAEPGAQLVYGLKQTTARDSFKQAVADGALEELLNYVDVEAGDVVFVPAGTLHAINEGILLFEIQQKSDLTYRIYDYNRRDARGNLRELHLDKALDVLHFGPPTQEKTPPLSLAPGRDLLVACPYFALERHRYVESRPFRTRPTSFEIWTLVESRATVAGEKLKAGDSLVLPASLGDYDIDPDPDCTLLRCYVPDLATDLLEPLRELGYDEARIMQTVRLT
ncbi:MAG TPA: mannose-6-phosphate isomerase [Caldilineae bacterium]|nr:mannose-6-phosphate isomerase [Caldilineae bacterium]